MGRSSKAQSLRPSADLLPLHLTCSAAQDFAAERGRGGPAARQGDYQAADHVHQKQRRELQAPSLCWPLSPPHHAHTHIHTHTCTQDAPCAAVQLYARLVLARWEGADVMRILSAPAPACMSPTPSAHPQGVCALDGRHVRRDARPAASRRDRGRAPRADLQHRGAAHPAGGRWLSDEGRWPPSRALTRQGIAPCCAFGPACLANACVPHTFRAGSSWSHSALGQL